MRLKLKNINFFPALFLATLLQVIGTTDSLAQSDNKEKKVVQFTGVIVDQDGINELPGVHVYMPKSGRGTTTNVYGYFSMPALVGEDVVISSIGYLNQHYVVPEGKNNRVNVIFKMEEDTIFLQNVDISLYVSEREFKEAILALKLPEQNEILANQLDGASIARMLRNTPYDASLNARYYFDQQYYYMQDNYGPRTNPFLNPFNWGRFIQSLKKKK